MVVDVQSSTSASDMVWFARFEIDPLLVNRCFTGIADNCQLAGGAKLAETTEAATGDHGSEIAVSVRVRDYADTDAESRGVVVEDFGEMTPQAVDIGTKHFADPARRWAVLLDTGTLVFVDTDQLVPE